MQANVKGFHWLILSQFFLVFACGVRVGNPHTGTKPPPKGYISLNIVGLDGPSSYKMILNIGKITVKNLDPNQVTALSRNAANLSTAGVSSQEHRYVLPAGDYQSLSLELKAENSVGIEGANKDVQYFPLAGNKYIYTFKKQFKIQENQLLPLTIRMDFNKSIKYQQANEPVFSLDVNQIEAINPTFDIYEGRNNPGLKVVNIDESVIGMCAYINDKVVDDESEYEDYFPDEDDEELYEVEFAEDQTQDFIDEEDTEMMIINGSLKEDNQDDDLFLSEDDDEIDFEEYFSEANLEDSCEYAFTIQEIENGEAIFDYLPLGTYDLVSYYDDGTVEVFEENVTLESNQEKILDAGSN